MLKNKNECSFKQWTEVNGNQFKDQIENMSADEKDIAFNTKLKFGTAGIRGKMGPGPGMFNIFTIIESTYGYAKYLKSKYKEKEILVVIGTDNRLNNDLFSKTAARVLSSFGIKTARALMTPTPFLSFAIRNLNAQGGINITASHNPPTDSGYKVYDHNGCQILPNDVNLISDYSKEIDCFLNYDFMDKTSLMDSIPQNAYDEYEKKIMSLSRIKSKEDKVLKIVFSPQHGTAEKFTPIYLKKNGYKIINVKEQMGADPYFSGTESPNPESPLAYQKGIEYCKQYNADIMITADPDADRIGVAALDREDGNYKIVTGNQIASIILNYLIKKNNQKNSYIVYSYVSSHLPSLIAKKNNIESYVVATGFKWIGNLIEELKDKNYIFGFEESYGSLINGDIARDKDSIQASIIVAEIAEEAKKENKTLWDLLREIYSEYGYFDEETFSISFEGANAIEKRISFMDRIRRESKNIFDDEYKVIDMINGKDKIAPMNLVRFNFKSGSWIGARPSGTEPKIKFYKVAVGKTKEELYLENEKMKEYIKLF